MCDVDEFKAPHILFVRGVYLQDCKMKEKVKVECKRSVASSTTAYKKIPSVFTDINQWPASTNLKCWACDCLFTWEPMFITESISFSGTDRGKFEPIKPIGNYCSIPCATIFIEKEYPKNRNWEMKELLKLLHYILTGIKITELPSSRESPKKTDREEYGGQMDIGSFQNAIRQVCRGHRICFPTGLLG